MSSVFSKLIDKTSERYGIRQERLTQGVVGLVTTLYLLKLGYPYLNQVAAQAKKKATSLCRDISDHRHTASNNNNNNVKDDGKASNNGAASAGDEASSSLPAGNKGIGTGLDREFLARLLTLLKIMIPGWRTKEAALLTSVTLALLARTFLSVYVATLEGSIVKRIVLRDGWGFFSMLIRWFGIALPATFVNSAIRYFEGRLALSFRGRLVKHAYNMYLSQQTYYRVSALDSRLGGAEQRLTDDLSELASSVAHLYTSLTKPLLDCALVGIALASFSARMGSRTIPGPLLATAVIGLTGQVLRLASPKFGQLVAEEASRRGRLRQAHARVSAHAEEIAFYGGQDAELRHLNSAYDSLVVHVRRVLKLKLWYVMLEQFLMKYVWSGTGLFVIALPVLFPVTSASRASNDDTGVSERTQYLTTSKYLLSSGADAVERLMSSYKEAVALAGYTARVGEMLDVFKDTALCKYQKGIVVGQHRPITGNDGIEVTRPSENILHFEDGVPQIRGIVRESTDGSIGLTNVPIVTPNCEVIVPSLTLRIQPGDHLLITGPNGCGKSSLFRIVSGLWPVYGGELTRPKETGEFTYAGVRPTLFYIPQRPYMTVGTLRDQIIYPSDSTKGKYTDEELLHLLDLVDLRSLAEREAEGLSSRNDWDSTLSGGEKQRLAMARLFFHAPRYALLDECTSAVSLEAEGTIYEAAKRMGITLLTVTHRVASLSKFHKLILRFDGEGGWDLGPLNQSDVQVKVANHEQDMDKEEPHHHHRLQELRDMLAKDPVGIS
ncbi:ATP-binding cassette sub-family D member 1 [Neodiprion pinetum]|uniref:ATP-binding cassette sub-family D member n=1 Tax=Neodiprion lecontei TaxID=441921 RepID=A0A6J0BX11_NEOLC|nr:ATP-binding cassette sub-family D member [Neodiprion lecontei]XP_046489329.1 ATP-binding cassette sub-family D member [Neodiprion pinetum]